MRGELPHAHPARVEPGLAGADVELPGVPRAADHLAAPLVAVHAGLGRGDVARDDPVAEAAALVRAAVGEREELAAEVEDDDPPLPGLHELAPARRDLPHGRHHVPRRARGPRRGPAPPGGGGARALRRGAAAHSPYSARALPP